MIQKNSPTEKPHKGGQSFLFNKPDSVLTQFRPVEGKKTLSDFGPFPKEVNPVGRLDEDSEGLVLLTSDGVLHQRLIDPRNAHPRRYIVQVERVPEGEAVEKLSKGVDVEGVVTRPAEVRLLPEPPDLHEKNTPVRFRKTVPTAWLEITLREGRNRQIRKMTAAVGHPTLRLIRVSFGPLSVGELGPGEMRPLTSGEMAELRASVNLVRPGKKNAQYDVTPGKKSGTAQKPWQPRGGGGQGSPWSKRGAGGTRNTRGRG